MRQRGSGTVYRRGNRFWIKYSDRGKAHFEPSSKIPPDATPEQIAKATREAERQLRKRVGGLLNNIPAPDRSLRYEDLRENYYLNYQTKGRRSLRFDKEGRPHLDKVARLDSFFSGFKANEITTETAMQFAVEQQKNELSNASINRSLAALKKMLRDAMKAGRLASVRYIEMLPESAPRSGFIEREQYDKLFRALPDFLKLPLAIGFFTGMRRAEVLNLRWENVSFLNRVIELKAGTTKNGEARTAPIPEPLRVLLEAQHKAKPAGFELVCFRSDKKGHPRRIGDFRKRWRKALAEAGLGTNLLFHDLRRSAVRAMIRAGIPQRVAQDISGHQTASVFARYNITSENDIREAARKIEDFHENSCKTVTNGTAAQPADVVVN